MLNLCVSHIPGTVDACPINGQMHLRFRVQKGMIVSSKLIYNCDKNNVAQVPRRGRNENHTYRF